MKSRALIFVVIVGFGAVAAGWIYQSQSRFEQGRAELVIPDNIDYFFTDLKYRVMTEAGTLDYEFQSKRLEHRPLNDVSHIEVPSLQIYRDAGQWQIDSQQGELQHQHNLLRLQDQVVMLRLGAHPMQIYTESIRFEPDRDTITSESSILMQSVNARIEAEQGIFDLANNVFSLTKARTIYYHGNS